jgi:hypothetical protein
LWRVIEGYTEEVYSNILSSAYCKINENIIYLMLHSNTASAAISLCSSSLPDDILDPDKGRTRWNSVGGTT